MNSKHIRRSSGFTYIEMILTVTIVLSLGILSTGFYSGYLLRNTTANTKDEILQLARKAQMYSVGGRYKSSWGIHSGSGSLYLFKGQDFNTRDPQYDEVILVSDNINITGLSDVYFNKYSGIPSIPLNITVSGGGTDKYIRITEQGRISD